MGYNYMFYNSFYTSFDCNTSKYVDHDEIRLDPPFLAVAEWYVRDDV